MNQSDVIAAVAVQAGTSQKVVRAVLDAFADAVKTELQNADGSIRLMGVGTWTRGESPARTARNPRTGEKVKIPARAKVRFAPASTLREALNPKK